eukprot:gene51118-18519_t
MGPGSVPGFPDKVRFSPAPSLRHVLPHQLELVKRARGTERASTSGAMMSGSYGDHALVAEVDQFVLSNGLSGEGLTSGGADWKNALLALHPDQLRAVMSKGPVATAGVRNPGAVLQGRLAKIGLPGSVSTGGRLSTGDDSLD